jgi:hypothetical protein
MIELFRSNGSQVAIKSLFQQTFKGRRFEITKGHLTSITDILKLRCPVLNQTNFVSIDNSPCISFFTSV